MVSPAAEGAISHLPLTSIRFPLLAPESRFPDNIACCGNRKWSGSGDARVTLVVNVFTPELGQEPEEVGRLCLRNKAGAIKQPGADFHIVRLAFIAVDLVKFLALASRQLRAVALISWSS